MKLDIFIYLPTKHPNKLQQYKHNQTRRQ